MGYLLACLILLSPVLLYLPLVVYCHRRRGGVRLRASGAAGFLLGGSAGFFAVILELQGSGGIDLGAGLAIIVFVTGGCALAGAYAGVAFAECMDPDAARRARARAGALYGLLPGAALAALVFFATAAKDFYEPGWAIWTQAMVLGAAVGAMVGATRTQRARTAVRHGHIQRGGAK